MSIKEKKEGILLNTSSRISKNYLSFFMENNKLYSSFFSYSNKTRYTRLMSEISKEEDKCTTKFSLKNKTICLNDCEDYILPGSCELQNILRKQM